MMGALRFLEKFLIVAKFAKNARNKPKRTSAHHATNKYATDTGSHCNSHASKNTILFILLARGQQRNKLQ